MPHAVARLSFFGTFFLRSLGPVGGGCVEPSWLLVLVVLEVVFHAGTECQRSVHVGLSNLQRRCPLNHVPVTVVRRSSDGMESRTEQHETDADEPTVHTDG